MTAPTTEPTTTQRPATTSADTGPTLEEQAGDVVMPQAAGYVGHRTISIGLRQGLIATLADHPEGMTAGELAAAHDFDPFYVSIWCRSGLACAILEPAPGDDASDPADARTGRLVLAPHIATLLLDDTAPDYVGAQFVLLEQPEVFDDLEANLATGHRTWWDEASPTFIEAVASSGRAFYLRLVPDGLARIPGLADRLGTEARILDTACGTGFGLVQLARAHPAATVVGADGDVHSLELARRRVAEAGMDHRVELLHVPLEDLDLDPDFAVVVNNISMHECRDIDRVTTNVHRALEPGGWFVVSDIPFPDTLAGLRTLSGRVMSGIQFWEGQIDDQLLPRTTYDDLLARHGFTDIGAFELDPAHAVTHGRRPT